MKATDFLMEEHRVIERVLDSLDQMVARIEQGEPIQTEFFLEAAEFIRGFADGCHHRKEENVLFSRLVEHGFSRQAGPVAVMLAEHEQGRGYTRGLREAVNRWQAGEEAARAEIIRTARGYTQLLRQHIQKEDNILFPMANRAIPALAHEQVWADFERVEHAETGPGVHEKYLALADRLEKTAA